MFPSTRTKESIKTALAMTIAYGISLSMDWDRPYWAGFAVALSAPQASASMMYLPVAVGTAVAGILYIFVMPQLSSFTGLGLMMFALLALTANIPHSARPEKAFLHQVGRFFRSCEYLMSTMRWDLTMIPTCLDRWKKAFHEREVATLPEKLGAWGKAVDTSALEGTSADQVQELTANLQALAYRVQELMMHERARRQSCWCVRCSQTCAPGV